MTQWRKILMAILPALMLLFMASPALVLAADDEGDAHAAETDSHGEEDAHSDESSGEMMEASAGAGTGIALSLLVLVLTIVMLVVVVVGVSISIIGGGYLSSQSD